MKKIIGLLAFLALVGFGTFAQDTDDFGVDGIPLTQAEMDATSGGDAFDLLYAKIEYGKNPYSPNAIRDKGWNAPNDLDNTSVGLINRTHGKNGTESQLKGQMDRAKELDNTALNFFVPVDSAKKIIEGNGTAGDFFDVASSIPGLKFLKGVKAVEKVAEVGRIANKVEGKAEDIGKATGKIVEQYALKAAQNGFYPVMQRGAKGPVGEIFLNSGDVWKYGTTKNPLTRYTQSFLENTGQGLNYFKMNSGSLGEALQMEKIQITNFREKYGKLPPGNKIVK